LTVTPSQPSIGSMPSKKSKKPSGGGIEREFILLESRIRDLVVLCQHLREENTSLQTRQGTLVSERAALIEKNESSRNRVEAMIAQLKSMETGA